jgi:hypothetical protein
VIEEASLGAPERPRRAREIAREAFDSRATMRQSDRGGTAFCGRAAAPRRRYRPPVIRVANEALLLSSGLRKVAPLANIGPLAAELQR